MSKGIKGMASTMMCLRTDRGKNGYHADRENNYITKKVRVVSFASDTPTGTPFHPHQISLNYLKQYGSYGLHKILASGQITT